MGWKLSERLRRVAEQVLPGAVVADVGTDHGRLPVWLVLAGRVPSAIAMDVRPKPLSVARKTVAAACVGDRVQTRLSDGLSALKPGEAATVTICGMGGGLMSRILSAHPAVLDRLGRVVLQPNNDAAKLRATLQSLCWHITDEDLLIEGKYAYPVITAEPSLVFQRYSTEDIAFGPILRQRRPPELVEVMRREVARLEYILSKCGSNPEAVQRFEAERAMVLAELGEG